MRDPESLAKEKYLSTVCKVVEISSKTLMNTIVRVLAFLSQETSLWSRRLKQKFPFNLKVTSFLSRRNIWNVKEIFLFYFSSLWLDSMSFIHTISIKDNTCLVIFEVVLCWQCFIALLFYYCIHAKMGCTKQNFNAKQRKNKQTNTGTLLLHLLKKGIAYILNILHFLVSPF